MNVTVFGGAKPQQGEPEYEEAKRLGQLLAQAGHIVYTGGYMGTMEAISRGAAESGGQVVGITCGQIERWRNSRANPWVNDELKLATLEERLVKLIDSCEVAMALPGGPGTLAEIALMWNRIIIAAIVPKPIILIGPGWQDVFETLFTRLGKNISEEDRQLLTFAKNVDEAFSLIENFQQ